MSETLRMWIEVSFNVTYLIVVWGLVILMVRNQKHVAPEHNPVAQRFMWAFGLLALGDTGHVGFRVVAYALGGLEIQPVIAGVPISLVGIGALATAITVTFFYVLMLDIWRSWSNKPLGWFGWILLAAALVRFIVMALPQNEWYRVDPPQPWGILRNLPLMVLGLGVMFLVLKDGLAKQDRTFIWIGVMVLLSYACYMPVIFWSSQVPILGMLMIPKTMAYLGVALLAYREFYMPRVLPRERAAIAAE